MTKSKFYFIIIEEGAPADVGQAEDLKELRTKLAKRLDETAARRQVFVFHGSRWLVTPGKQKYLVSPHGPGDPYEEIAIFDSPLNTIPRDDGMTDGVVDEAPDADYTASTQAPASPSETPPTDPSDDDAAFAKS